MIEFKRIKYGDGIFDMAYKLYRNSFPIHEQRLLDNQIDAMSEKGFKCEAIYDEKNFVGIIFHWVNEDYSYVEHYAIYHKCRGNNVGSRALIAFCKRFKSVILEIDPPVDEISIRREKFYVRLGFKLNKYKHFHPPYRKGYSPHKLILLSYPGEINEDQYNRFSVLLNEKIMIYSEGFGR